MMKREDLLEKLETQPFIGFRLTLSDGRHVEISHPDQMMVLRHKLIIGVGRDRAHGFSGAMECALLHVTSIEQKEAA